MRKHPFFYSLVCATLLFILTAGPACGQGAKGVIRVTDKKTGEAVAFAHICLEGLKSGTPKYSLTSIEGTAPNDAREPSKIAISYVGFATYIDTIQPGQSLNVELKPTVLNIDEVVVTAQYTPEKADKSIYKIEVINSRQIEMKGATNMTDLLKDQTTMRVSQNGVLGTSLKIQGMSGQNIKFLMDGVPMIGRMNGNFDLNQINLNNVDHVEVIEGPMSVVYGSNAIAGVINIITKENKASAYSVAASGYYETVGNYNFDGSVSFNHKKHSAALNGARNFFDGYSYYDTSRVEDFKPRRQVTFDGYYAFTSKRFRIKLAGDYFNELLIDKGALQPRYYETALDNEFKTIRYSVKTEASLKLFESHYLNILGSYSRYDRYKQTFFKDLTTLTSTPVENSDGRDTTTILSWTGRATFAKNSPEKPLNYQLGLDLLIEQGTGKRILDEKQQLGDYAAFLSVTWNPVKPLSIQPGVRLIYNTKYDAPLVYAISAKWNIIPELGLRLSMARGFRAPDIKELYLNFVDVNHTILGNPDLKAERSYNFNLNLNFAKENRKTAWGADVTGFYNMIDDVIVLAHVAGEDEKTYSYGNVDEFRTTGVQASASFSLYPRLRLEAGLAETGITGTGPDGGSPGDFVFGTDVTLTGSYRFLKPELTLSLFYKYSGKSPVFTADDDGITIGQLDPYNTLDFTAAKGFWTNRIRLSAGVKNLFDTKVVPATGLAGGGHAAGSGGSENVGWGRTFFLRLAFVFNKYK